MSQRPFKKFHCDQDDVFLIPPVAFKIWMYHYTREGKERKSWPSREVICAKLNISLDTLKKWRKWLVKNKWLVPVGQRDSRTGTFSVPVFMVDEGSVVGNISHGNRGRKLPPPSRGKITTAVAGEKFPPEVDSELEVDSKREVEEKPMSIFTDKIRFICEQANIRPDISPAVFRELRMIQDAHPEESIDDKFESFLSDNVGTVTSNPVAAYLKIARKGLTPSLSKSEKSDPRLYKEYLLWLASAYSGMNLTTREKNTIERFLATCSYPMSVLKVATGRILDGLNPENGFDRCGDKLANNLEIQCEVSVQAAARRKRTEQEVELATKREREKALAEQAAQEAARKAEEALIEDEI